MSLVRQDGREVRPHDLRTWLPAEGNNKPVPQYQAIPRIVLSGGRLAVDDLPAGTAVVRKPFALEVILDIVQRAAL